jgi:hypothetical protein
MPYGLLLQDGKSIILQDGESILLLQQGDVMFAAMRGRDIRTAIRDQLIDTGAFGGVYLSGPSPPDVTTQAWVLPAKDSHTIDADYDGMVIVRAVMEIHYVVRDNDPDIIDQTIDRLYALSCNALNGQSLAGVTFPVMTRITKSRWIDKPPVRMIATLEYAYMAETWAGFNTED